MIELSEAYIAITGNIASGKSNLAYHIKNFWNFNLITEKVDVDVLSRYYADRKTFGYETQEFFILTRAQELKKVLIIGGFWVSDYMFGVDSAVYAKNLLVEKNITKRQYRQISDLESRLKDDLPSPDLLIYLQTSPDVLQKRIRKRGRREESTLLGQKGEEYLKRLEAFHESSFGNYNGKRALIKTDELSLVPDFNRGNPLPTNIEETLQFIVECLKRPYEGKPFVFFKSFG